MFKNIHRFKILLVSLILILFFIFLFSRGHVYESSQLEYGVTFSKKHAQSLNLDWQKIYLSIFDDLGARKIRLPAYWDEIEPQAGNYFWQDFDWQINRASERPVEIILALGARLPRWPECHFPEWTSGRQKAEVENKTLDYISQVVKRYKNNQKIIAWQIENEPFLSHFGDCPKFDKNFLDQEIMLVRSLDARPIIITDSGELSFWLSAARRADIFGTSMYRDTYSESFNRYIHYPIRPGFFKFKKNLASLLAKPDSWLVIEMQAEPWGKEPYQNLSQAERDLTMNIEKFKSMVEFGRQSGFKEFYLWGVEFWYWELSRGRPEVWQYARTLYSK